MPVGAVWYACLYRNDEQFSYLQFMSASLSGDLDDLCAPTLFNCSKLALPTELVGGNGHCSLLVKPVWADVDNVNAGASDLLFGHTTWSGFETMTRVYKRYDFPLTLDGTHGIVPATSLSFSSYPAALFSDDDWIQSSAGLTISGRDECLEITHPRRLLWARTSLHCDCQRHASSLGPCTVY